LSTPWKLPKINSTEPEPVPHHGKVYLLAFTNEEWPRVAKYLNIWSYGQMRGKYQGLAIIPWRGATMLVADKDACPFLNATEGVKAT
jgi:hypothetical protein